MTKCFSGISLDNLTVYTGEDSLVNLGKVYAKNGKKVLDIWKTDDCNSIDGSDGSQFPPHLMKQDKELKIFISSLCRTISLKFDREVGVLDGIPAWRYKLAKNELGTSLTNPNNKCYCDAEVEKCQLDGVFDASKCVNGAPLLISYPHFMEGDEKLFDHFEGLSPNPEIHETYADIHPTLAIPLAAASKLQMNFKVTPYQEFFIFQRLQFYTKLPKDIVLPIFWFEVTSGEIPDEILSIVFNSTISADDTELTMQDMSTENIQNEEISSTFEPETDSFSTDPSTSVETNDTKRDAQFESET